MLAYVAYGVGTGHVKVMALDVTNQRVLWTKDTGSGAALGSTLDAVVGSASFSGAPEPALFVNAGQKIMALRLADGGATTRHCPALQPQGSQVQNTFTSGLAYANGRLYAGDALGKLYVLDAKLAVVKQTTDTPPAGATVYSTPIVVTDAKGADTVFFTRGDQNVWFFDPAEGTLFQIETAQTAIAATAYDAHHRILFGASQPIDQSTGALLGQVFAVRVDELIQVERAFVIESQLLQDFDPAPDGQAHAVARYQTHVSVVDDNRAPLARQAIKVWAEAPETKVTIDGQPYTISPDAPAQVETDGAGSLTIVSDAGDLTAAPLRLWAAFMDPHERVPVYPDSEFHARLADTHADAQSDAPHRINLATAKPYDDKPLFDDDGQAQQTAQGVQTLTRSVGFGAAVAGRGAARRRGNRPPRGSNGKPPQGRCAGPGRASTSPMPISRTWPCRGWRTPPPTPRPCDPPPPSRRTASTSTASPIPR